MSSGQYTRERKEDKPVLAICYDFDKTLSPDDMQSFTTDSFFETYDRYFE